MKKAFMIAMSLNLLLLSQSSYAFFDFLYKEDFGFRCTFNVNPNTSEVIKTEKVTRNLTMQTQEPNEIEALKNVKKRVEEERVTKGQVEKCILAESKLIEKGFQKDEPSHLEARQYPIGRWHPFYKFEYVEACEVKHYKVKSDLQYKTDLCKEAKKDWCRERAVTGGQRKRYKNIVKKACEGVHDAESHTDRVGINDGDRDVKTVEPVSAPESSKASATEQ